MSRICSVIAMNTSRSTKFFQLFQILALAVVLTGCTPPCFFEGKAVQRRDAENMKQLGMKVQCP